MIFLISSIKEDLDIVKEFLELRFQTYDLSESSLSKIVNHQSNDLLINLKSENRNSKIR